VSLIDSSLNELPSLYFALDEPHELATVVRLIPTKDLTAHAPSILEARARMREAAAGLRPKRPPITVEDRGDAVYVIDGNATLGVALASGWLQIPVRFATPVHRTPPLQHD